MYNYKIMLCRTSKLLQHIKIKPASIFPFSNEKNKKIRIISDPSQVSKLIFDNAGLCKIYQYKFGQNNLRKIVRYVSMLTFLNGALFGMQISRPIFGKINMVSFGLATGLGYMILSFLQVYSRRIVHRLYIQNDFETIHVEFFNAFWKPRTEKYNISEFQQPIPGFADFTRFQLTSLGKIWINLPKNQFRNVEDYQQTLDYVLLGKPLTNLNIINLKKKKSDHL